MADVASKIGKNDFHRPKSWGQGPSWSRNNVAFIFNRNCHLAKVKTREVANVTHLQNVDARRPASQYAIEGEREREKVAGGEWRRRRRAVTARGERGLEREREREERGEQDT